MQKPGHVGPRASRPASMQARRQRGTRARRRKEVDALRRNDLATPRYRHANAWAQVTGNTNKHEEASGLMNTIAWCVRVRERVHAPACAHASARSHARAHAPARACAR
eukprot:15474851-Alexandrium_andersonii.AAC.1